MIEVNSSILQSGQQTDIYQAILKTFEQDYIFRGDLTKQLPLSYYGRRVYKLIKKNHVLSNSELSMLEIMETPRSFNQQHVKKILNYYQEMSKLYKSIEYYQKPSLLEIRNIHRFLIKERWYICIVREYVEGLRLLSKDIFPDQYVAEGGSSAQAYICGPAPEQRIRYYKQIVMTLGFVEKTLPNFHFGEITPYNLVIGRDYTLDEEKDTVKIIDTYCDRVLRSIDPDASPNSKELLKRDSFCSKYVIQSKQAKELRSFDDVWGTCMSMYSMETGKSFFSGVSTHEDLKEQVAEIANEKSQASFLSTRLSSEYGAESLLHSVLNSMLSDKTFGSSTKGLEMSLINTNRVAPQSLPMNETEKAKIKQIVRIEYKEEQKEAKPEWEKCVSADETTFAAKEVAQELLADANHEKVNEYLTGISYAMLGEKVKSVEREARGFLTGSGIILFPSGETVPEQFENRDTIKGNAYLQQREGSVFIKLEALFTANELNPIIVNSYSSRDKPIVFVPEAKEGEPPKPSEIIKPSLVLGCTKQDVEQMKKRLMPMNINKQHGKMYKEKVAKYTQKYGGQVLVNYGNFQRRNPHAMHKFQAELVPLLSVKFKDKLIQLNLRNNRITDQNVEMITQQNFSLFYTLEYLNLANNQLTDGALESMRSASIRTRRPYFSFLKSLIMNNNQIVEGLCFKTIHGFKQLEFIDFSHNQILLPLYDEMFRTLKNRKLVLLGGNPFVNKLMQQTKLENRQRQEQQRIRYNVQLQPQEVFMIDGRTEQMSVAASQQNMRPPYVQI